MLILFLDKEKNIIRIKNKIVTVNTCELKFGEDKERYDILLISYLFLLSRIKKDKLGKILMRVLILFYFYLAFMVSRFFSEVFSILFSILYFYIYQFLIIKITII